MNDASPAARVPRCLRCGAGIAWSGNPHRPFCSLSCRLIDLGVWLEERYRIPGPAMSEDASADDGDGEPIGNAVGETVECGDGHCDADETHDYAR